MGSKPERAAKSGEGGGSDTEGEVITWAGKERFMFISYAANRSCFHGGRPEAIRVAPCKWRFLSQRFITSAPTPPPPPRSAPSVAKCIFIGASRDAYLSIYFNKRNQRDT